MPPLGISATTNTLFPSPPYSPPSLIPSSTAVVKESQQGSVHMAIPSKPHHKTRGSQTEQHSATKRPLGQQSTKHLPSVTVHPRKPSTEGHRKHVAGHRAMLNTANTGTLASGNASTQHTLPPASHSGALYSAYMSHLYSLHQQLMVLPYPLHISRAPDRNALDHPWHSRGGTSEYLRSLLLRGAGNSPLLYQAPAAATSFDLGYARRRRELWGSSLQTQFSPYEGGHPLLHNAVGPVMPPLLQATNSLQGDDRSGSEGCCPAPFYRSPTLPATASAGNEVMATIQNISHDTRV